MIRRHRASGFVLPVVILLVIIVGVSSSIMLQRHVARSLTVRRQLHAYQEHHGSKSIQAVVDAWLKTPTATTRELENMLEEDGLALTIDNGGGSTINVHLFKGQGTLLSRPSAAPPEDQEALANAILFLRQELGDGEAYRLATRPAGPVAVDPNEATPEVLRAIVRGVLGDARGATQYEQSLIDASLSEGGVSLQTLSNIAADAGLEQAERNAIGRFFVVTPDVWRFRIDQFGSPTVGRPLLARYQGLMLLEGTINASTNAFERPPPFLTWESVDPDALLPVE